MHPRRKLNGFVEGVPRFPVTSRCWSRREWKLFLQYSLDVRIAHSIGEHSGRAIGKFDTLRHERILALDFLHPNSYSQAMTYLPQQPLPASYVKAKNESHFEPTRLPKLRPDVPGPYVIYGPDPNQGPLEPGESLRVGRWEVMYLPDRLCNLPPANYLHDDESCSS